MNVKLAEGILSNKWQDFFVENSPNFVKQMKIVSSMEDTFGLCGLISYFVMGISINPSRWSNISFDALKSKAEFDLYTQEKSELTKSPALSFLDNHQDIFHRTLIAIKDETEFDELSHQLNENQKLYFAVVFNYPRHKGNYTHWIAILERYLDKLVIGGDLSPFGIRDSFIKEVNMNDIVPSIINTLNDSPTTQNADALKKDAVKSGARGTEKFTSNIGLATFSL